MMHAEKTPPFTYANQLRENQSITDSLDYTGVRPHILLAVDLYGRLLPPATAETQVGRIDDLHMSFEVIMREPSLLFKDARIVNAITAGFMDMAISCTHIMDCICTAQDENASHEAVMARYRNFADQVLGSPEGAAHPDEPISGPEDVRALVDEMGGVDQLNAGLKATLTDGLTRTAIFSAHFGVAYLSKFLEASGELRIVTDMSAAGIALGSLVRHLRDVHDAESLRLTQIICDMAPEKRVLAARRSTQTLAGAFGKMQLQDGWRTWAPPVMAGALVCIEDWQRRYGAANRSRALIENEVLASEQSLEGYRAERRTQEVQARRTELQEVRQKHAALMEPFAPPSGKWLRATQDYRTLFSALTGHTVPRAPEVVWRPGVTKAEASVLLGSIKRLCELSSAAPEEDAFLVTCQTLLAQEKDLLGEHGTHAVALARHGITSGAEQLQTLRQRLETLRDAWPGLGPVLGAHLPARARHLNRINTLLQSLEA